jgi:hypothetical protein
LVGYPTFFFKIRQRITCVNLANVYGSWIMLHGTKLNKEGKI